MKQWAWTLVVAWGLLMAGGVDAAPMILADPQHHDFGMVIRGQHVERVFPIRNGGDAPLVISLVRTSCGCAASFLEKAEIPPGESAPLRVRFDSSEFLGGIRKTVFLYSNDPAQPEYPVSFTADVRTLVRAEPDRINLGQVDLLTGLGASAPFRVILAAGAGKMTGLEYDRRYFDAACAAPRREAGIDIYPCRLEVRPGAPSGGILEALTVLTDLQEQPRYRINIYGRLRGAYELVPMLVDFGEVSAKGEGAEVVSVSAVDGKAFRILAVESDRPEVTAQVREGAAGGWDVELTLRPATLAEVVEGRVLVKTDHPDHPDVQIKYQGYVE